MNYGEIVNAKVTKVTLVEIPNQNLLQIREVQQSSLIWYDQEVLEDVNKDNDSDSDLDDLEDNN